MRWIHPTSGRALRLAYCLNLHPADTLEGVLAGLRDVTLPLARRLAPGAPFGAGMYLASDVAHALDAGGERALEPLRAALAEGPLDAFTFNAFPYARFLQPGLKQRVFEPTWAERERLDYTLAVGRVAARLAREGPLEPGHVSISTHGGKFGPFDAESRAACAAGLVACARGFAEIEAQTGVRLVLSVEPEPRSSANDTAEGAAFLAAAREAARADAELVRRHVGTCLDTCHAAVEHEPAAEALANATADGAPLGKLQFSSALRLERPADDARGRELLLGLDEPIFLHQVTASRDAELTRALDLPEARARWDAGDPLWREADEWRCHFHVPVDLSAVGDGAGRLGTTRDVADELLALALAAPELWNTPELHVEVETYTWDVLPGPARGPGDLVDGLERELRHVAARLTEAGWHPAHENPGAR